MALPHLFGIDGSSMAGQLLSFARFLGLALALSSCVSCLGVALFSLVSRPSACSISLGTLGSSSLFCFALLALPLSFDQHSGLSLSLSLSTLGSASLS